MERLPALAGIPLLLKTTGNDGHFQTGKICKQAWANHKKIKHTARITRLMAKEETLTTFDSCTVKGYDAAI